VIDLPVSTSGKEVFNVAVVAARKAGEVLRVNFRQERQVRYKGRANIVTDVDLQAEKALITFLRAEYPEHGILSEESDPIDGSSQYKWILDPLDGTNNYSFGIPFFSTVIALVRGEESMLGIVYDPLRDEMFSAVKGQGSALNGKSVSVSCKTKVDDALIGLDMGYIDEKGKSILGLMSRLWPDMYAYRILGSAALGMAYAACGRLDLYFHLLIYPWELAAGRLLVSEAGGMVTDWEGEPLKMGESSIIAANGDLHSDFMDRVRGAIL